MIELRSGYHTWYLLFVVAKGCTGPTIKICVTSCVVVLIANISTKFYCTVTHTWPQTRLEGYRHALCIYTIHTPGSEIPGSMHVNVSHTIELHEHHSDFFCPPSLSSTFSDKIPLWARTCTNIGENLKVHTCVWIGVFKELKSSIFFDGKMWTCGALEEIMSWCRCVPFFFLKFKNKTLFALSNQADKPILWYACRWKNQKPWFLARL